MRRKNDNYIHYEKSRKRHSGKGKALLIIIIILAAATIGFAAFYLINSRFHIINWQKQFNTDHMQGRITNNQSEKASLTGKPNKNLSVREGNNSKKQIELSDSKNQKGSDAVESEVQIAPSAAAVSNKVVNPDIETSQESTPVNIKGIYVTAKEAGCDKLKDLVDLADEKEINAFVIDIKDDFGRITYSMDSQQVKKIGADTSFIPDIHALMKTLKKNNIYPIARIVAFKDPYLAEHRKELAIKNKDGKVYRDKDGLCWVNPYNKEVWNYLVEVASAAAAVGFKEIQFDYIRFSTDPKLKKADFSALAKGKTKEDIIMEFTKYACKKLKPLGVSVSADVYGAIINSSIDAKIVGQNYVEMSKYLDYICPMIYPSHFGEGNYGISYPDLKPYEIIKKVMTASSLKLKKIPKGKHCAIVRPWLQDFTATWVKHHRQYGGEELRDQINGVYAAGYKEWLLWNSGGNYSASGLKE